MHRITNRRLPILMRPKLATARTPTPPPARFYQKPVPKSFVANLKKTSTGRKVLIGGSFAAGS